MLKIAQYEVKDGSHVWGDTAEKVAFNLNIDPANLMGSIAGGYAATRVQNNIAKGEREKEEAKRTLENDHYQQVNSILADLKIVFTPINVVYSVNGQVFEIIDAGEMTPHMKNAFLKKDGEYFKNLLLNKMNMEMQLAEQAFAKRLLVQSGAVKEATYLDAQEELSKIASEEFEKLSSNSLNDLGGLQLKIPVNFDNLRPFNTSPTFFNQGEFSKVAGIFDYFTNSGYDSIDLKDLKAQIKVGFLPDRVIFLYNGQLLDQLSTLNMNEDGYKAFVQRDKNFFYDFFNKEAAKIAGNIKKTNPGNETTPPSTEQLAAEDTNELDKKADTLEEVIESLELTPMERETLNVFKDADIHPIVYDKILHDRYGVSWTTYEFQSILKQIELDFKIEDGIEDNPLNKIAAIHAVSSEETTMFLNSFSFEKFVRVMNDKAVLFQEFQGNLDLEDILFGLEMAKAFKDDDIFVEFHHTIPQYISEELFKDEVRFISDQLYDEDNPEEKTFFDTVNGFLMRKWKEKDFTSMTDDDMIEKQKRTTELITHIIETILSTYAEEIRLTDPFVSVQEIIVNHGFLNNVSAKSKEAVKYLVTENVVRHVGAAIYLESRKEELKELLARIEKEGV